MLGSNAIFVRYPTTRARISTDSTASNRPVKSWKSVTSFSVGVAISTFTGGAIGLAALFAFSHPVIKASNKADAQQTRAV